jgi:O-antigen ligase
MDQLAGTTPLEQSGVTPARTGTTILETLSLLTLTGRTIVWEDGLELIKDRPFLGYGFHADRLVLSEHMHNTYLHGLLQTGVIGAIPLFVGLVFTWVLLYKAARRLSQLTVAHRHSVILAGGILALFSVRTIPESTGAIFGVDWLLLAPLLLYFELLNRNSVARTTDE